MPMRVAPNLCGWWDVVAAPRRWPNLWLLAGSHTILAALAYPLVLGDAPLSRV